MNINWRRIDEQKTDAARGTALAPYDSFFTERGFSAEAAGELMFVDSVKRYQLATVSSPGGNLYGPDVIMDRSTVLQFKTATGWWSSPSFVAGPHYVSVEKILAAERRGKEYAVASAAATAQMLTVVRALSGNAWHGGIVKIATGSDTFVVSFESPDRMLMQRVYTLGEWAKGTATEIYSGADGRKCRKYHNVLEDYKNQFTARVKDLHTSETDDLPLEEWLGDSFDTLIAARLEARKDAGLIALDKQYLERLTAYCSSAGLSAPRVVDAKIVQRAEIIAQVEEFLD
jgi:hypothetical protein